MIKGTPPPLPYFYRNKLPLHKRGQGRFSLGDKVTWMGKEGTIVEVVRYGLYPKRYKGLRIRGYWREWESYVVQDAQGKVYWPRVGNLTKIVEKEE